MIQYNAPVREEQTSEVGLQNVAEVWLTVRIHVPDGHLRRQESWHRSWSRRKCCFGNDEEFDRNRMPHIYGQLFYVASLNSAPACSRI